MSDDNGIEMSKNEDGEKIKSSPRKRKRSRKDSRKAAKEKKGKKETLTVVKEDVGKRKEEKTEREDDEKKETRDNGENVKENDCENDDDNGVEESVVEEEKKDDAGEHTGAVEDLTAPSCFFKSAILLLVFVGILTFGAYSMAWLVALIFPNQLHLPPEDPEENSPVVLAVFLFLFALIGACSLGCTFAFLCICFNREEDDGSCHIANSAYCCAVSILVCAILTFMMGPRRSFDKFYFSSPFELDQLYIPSTRLEPPYPPSRIITDEHFWTSYSLASDRPRLLGMEAPVRNGSACFVPETYRNSEAVLYDPEGIDPLPEPEITRVTKDHVVLAVDAFSSTETFSIGLLSFSASSNGTRVSRISVEAFLEGIEETWWTGSLDCRDLCQLLVKSPPPPSTLEISLRAIYSPRLDIIDISWQRRVDEKAWLTESADFFLDDQPRMMAVELRKPSGCSIGYWTRRGVGTTAASVPTCFTYCPATCMARSSTTNQLQVTVCNGNEGKEKVICCRGYDPEGPFQAIDYRYLHHLVVVSNIFFGVIITIVVVACSIFAVVKALRDGAI